MPGFLATSGFEVAIRSDNQTERLTLIVAQQSVVEPKQFIKAIKRLRPGLSFNWPRISDKK